ncbi:MAG TPA: hypothetical protein VIF57_10725 [Polyangia bacterium]
MTARLRPFAAVAVLAAAAVSRALAAEAEPPPVPRVALTDLVAKVARAQQEVKGVLAAARRRAAGTGTAAARQPADDGSFVPSLAGSWTQETISLPPRFLADFPQFATLPELSQKLARAANDVRARRGAAVTEDLARDLAKYHQQLADLSEATRSSAALVVSGGVSLGSYQGGFLHYYTQFLLAHRRAVTEGYALDPLTDGGGVRVATGASAGSINTFLSTLTGCRAAVTDPRKSLFWSAWIPVGFHNLIALDRVSFDAVLSQAPLDEAIARIGTLWSERQDLAGWTQACDAVIGLSATRLQAREIDFSPKVSGADRSDALRLKRQTEKFVLHIVGADKGKAPTFSPYRPSSIAIGPGDSPIDMIYPTLGEHALGEPGSLERLSNSFDEVATLLKASAAFPVAFAPVPLRLTIWRHEKAGFVPIEHGTVHFVDGGVLDNTPIGLAIKIEDWLRDRQETVPAQLVFLSSDAVGWMKSTGGSAPEPNARSMLGTYAPFIRDFISTAEQNELLNALENYSSIPRNVPARMMPIAGEQLSHFFAFAEEDFRIFDFFMGMVDAREYLASQQPLAVEVLAAAAGSKGPARTARPLAVDAPEFECFDQHRRMLRQAAVPDIGRIPACARVDANLIALLKASTDLRMQAQTELPAGTGPGIERFLATIQKYGYQYKQLKFRGAPARADTATRALRDSAQSLIQSLGAAQPFLEQYPVSMAGKALANNFEYQAPRWMQNVGVLATGGVEVGLTRFISPWQHFSFGPAALARLVRWETTSFVYNGVPIHPVAVKTVYNLGLRLEYAVGPALQLDLFPGFQADYISERAIWNSYYWAFGWFAQAELVLYQRLYVMGAIYGMPRDTRPDSDLAIEGTTRDWCCRYRIGLGLRFFSL